MRITSSGWSAAGGFSPLSLLKSEKCLILFFTGKRADGQRAQPKSREHFLDGFYWSFLYYYLEYLAVR
jgi:hypothetical protein